MKSRFWMLLSFLSGALLSAVVTAVGVLHWHQQQLELMWTTALRQSVQELRQLDRGDASAVRADLLRRLPGLVGSVSSFGLNEQTRPVLRSTRELMEETPQGIPADLRSAFQGL